MMSVQPPTPNTPSGDQLGGDAGSEEQATVNALTRGKVRDSGGEPPEISIRVLWCPAMYVLDHLGVTTLDRIAARAGTSASEIGQRRRWISIRQLSVFFAAVRELMPDDDSMEQVYRYRLSEAYGLLRHAFWAASPKVIIKLAARTLKPVVASVCEFEVLEERENAIRLRFKTARPEYESRQFCLSRRVQTAAFPTFWGLPPALVSEAKCIAWGDEVCEYQFRWQALPRWLPSVAGALLGAAVAALLHLAGWGNLPAWASLAALGAALARVHELRRAQGMNIAFGAEVQNTLRDLADEAAEAKREIFALHQRQAEWTALVEEQVAERTASVQAVVERIQRLREVRETDLRGFSHDLRNPMAVVRTNLEFLRATNSATRINSEVLDDLDHAVGRMDDLLTELMQTATAESRLVRLVPSMVDVETLTDQLRRRTRALVHGRDIRVSVFRNNSAPAAIETDVMAFDRVLDNLLTNAAKYTDQGSILVELDGSCPGFLSVKVSDTGCGIARDRLPMIFRAGEAGTAPSPRSCGVGLSVTVQLMAQIGGKLEVLSTPGRGTTFWAHFPARLRVSLVPRTMPSDAEHLASAVVTIRQGDPIEGP